MNSATKKHLKIKRIADAIRSVGKGDLNHISNNEIFSIFEASKNIAYEAKMPNLSDFKARRELLGFSIDEVSVGSGVSKSTISRVENNKECTYSHAKALFEWYAKQISNLKVK